MEKHTTSAKVLLNHATILYLHTGNLVNRSRLKKKCPSSPSEEIQDCVRATLNEWCATIPPTTSPMSSLVQHTMGSHTLATRVKGSTITPDKVNEILSRWKHRLPQDLPDTIDCSIPQATEAITPEEREELKVSVKLFICEADLSSIKDAVDKSCQVLAVSQLDSVIIAPPVLPEGESQTLENLQPAWTELEGLVQSHKIAAIGTSDLDKELLEQLYNWARVKPSSNQVNLASCCVMPPDLTAFAKEFDIQLLTHNDPKELITAASFQEAVQESTQDLKVADWRLEWVLRYSIIVKSRGIIKAKGYLVHSKRNNL